jgi:hypothetical protein
LFFANNNSHANKTPLDSVRPIVFADFRENSIEQQKFPFTRLQQFDLNEQGFSNCPIFNLSSLFPREISSHAQMPSGTFGPLFRLKTIRSLGT